MVEIYLMKKEHEYWNEIISFAERCSWKAGPFLAKKMQGNEFNEWERVCAICENGKVAGFSTFTERDELSEQYGFTPFIGFVFVDEKYRGKRLSERMIQHIISYAKRLGYEKVDYANCRECHITPDWLLVYEIDKGELVLYLTRPGTHSDLF